MTGVVTMRLTLTQPPPDPDALPVRSVRTLPTRCSGRFAAERERGCSGTEEIEWVMRRQIRATHGQCGANGRTANGGVGCSARHGSALPHAASSRWLNSLSLLLSSNGFDSIPFAHSQPRSTLLHSSRRRCCLPRPLCSPAHPPSTRRCLIRRHGAVHRKAFARGRSQEARTDAAREG